MLRLIATGIALFLASSSLLGNPLIPPKLLSYRWYHYEFGSNCRYMAVRAWNRNPTYIGLESFEETSGAEHCGGEYFKCAWDDNICQEGSSTMRLCQNGNIRIDTTGYNPEIWATTRGIALVNDRFTSECIPIMDRFAAVKAFRLRDKVGLLAPWLKVGQTYGIQFDALNQREQSALKDIEVELAVMIKGRVLVRQTMTLSEIQAQESVTSSPDWQWKVPYLQRGTAVVFRLSLSDKLNRHATFEYPYSVGPAEQKSLTQEFNGFNDTVSQKSISQKLKAEAPEPPETHSIYAVEMRAQYFVYDVVDHGAYYLPCLGQIRDVTLSLPSGANLPLGYGNGCGSWFGVFQKSLDLKELFLPTTTTWRLSTSFDPRGDWSYALQSEATITYKYYVPK